MYFNLIKLFSNSKCIYFRSRKLVRKLLVIENISRYFYRRLNEDYHRLNSQFGKLKNRRIVGRGIFVQKRDFVGNFHKMFRLLFEG